MVGVSVMLGLGLGLRVRARVGLALSRVDLGTTRLENELMVNSSTKILTENSFATSVLQTVGLYHLSHLCFFVTYFADCISI